MAALAEILHDEGKDVAGSDIEKYVFTQDGLIERGIPVLPFSPENIQPGDLVIAGLSFDENHPELAKALAMDDVQVLWYNDFLGRMLKNYTSICIAGCHGKSTTTGLLAHVLEDYQSTGYLIGDGHGHMPCDAKYFALESCEFKRHFLAYHPDYAILTNIELDHIDYYKDLDDYISAFQTFADQIQKGAVIFHDDPYLKKLHYPVPVVSYGMEEGSTYRAVNVVQNEEGTAYDVIRDGETLAHVRLQESGMPFAWDALGVFAMAHTLGMNPEDIAARLHDFKGIARRFVIDEAGGQILVDDYAHHPTAIAQMIRAVKTRYPERKIAAFYKPDRYSRLQYFLEGFAEALNSADVSGVLDFDANAKPEDETITVTIQDLLDRLNDGMLLDISEQSAERLMEMADKDQWVFLFMSSKNIYLLRDLLKEKLEARC